MIRVEKLSVSYESGKQIFDEISFEIGKGESVGLLGANGTGKTTLFKALLGLIPSKGTVIIDDIELSKDTLWEIRKKLGYVLQNSDNQMFMPTVAEDIMFGPLNYGHSREEVEKKVDDILETLELQDLKYRQNHKLSGGEKRMAAIATILAMRPNNLLMDEPTSALDPYNRRKVINTINSLQMTKLIASHDLDMILDTCSRVIIISDGHIVACGGTEQILTNRELLEGVRLELPYRYQNN